MLPSLAPRKGSHLVLVLPDLHIPHQDKPALRCALKAHELLRPARTIILGDWIDCEGFSSHPVKSRAEHRAGTFFEEEIRPCNLLLDRLQNNTGHLIYIEGNHEHRVERMVAEKGGLWNDLADLVSPRRLLSEGRSNFTWVPYVPATQILKETSYPIAKDLIAIHGWSFATHVAATHLRIAKKWSVVFGHCHRMDSATSRDPIDDTVYEAWSPGCLSKLQPLYMAHNPTNWVHGFSLVYVKDDLSSWTNYTVRIHKGRCVLPNGVRIDGNEEMRVAA